MQLVMYSKLVRTMALISRTEGSPQWLLVGIRGTLSGSLVGVVSLQILPKFLERLVEVRGDANLTFALPALHGHCYPRLGAPISPPVRCFP